jgi:NSD Cys-His rich domain
VSCWVCNLPASGICRFCGRAVCKEHARTMPYILQNFASSQGLQGLVVGDVLYCGVCRPRPEPVPLDFLEP